MITGKRTKFSAFGSIKSMDGKAAPAGTIVIAKSETGEEKGLVGENTEFPGTFRIRGLNPGEIYRISVEESM